MASLVNLAEIVTQVCVLLGMRGLKNSDLRRVELAFGEALQARTGKRLGDICTDAELMEFEYIFDHHSEVEATRWLEEHVSEYPSIVLEEISRLAQEVVEYFSSSELLGTPS